MTIQQFYLKQSLELSLSCGCHVCFTEAVLSFCVFKTQLIKMDKTGKQHLIFPTIQEKAPKFRKGSSNFMHSEYRKNLILCESGNNKSHQDI